ncbi:MAG TPA: hypothetical protein VM097_13925 [Mycobacteriales bacterium]|nr:hypothetical protein [Mycobacteriales bacterium]
MPREQYVRPPLVAREPGSRHAAVWRVRIGGAVLAVLTLLGFLWLFLTFSGVTNGEDPGLGGLQPPSGSRSSAFVPLGSAGSSTS